MPAARPALAFGVERRGWVCERGGVSVMTSGHAALIEYLDRLPDGLASHPECRMKGAVVRSMLETMAGYSPAASPVPEVRELLERPPAASAWVPEVHCHALMLVVAHDLHGDEASYLEYTLRGNRALLDSLAYRVLFRFVSPKRVLADAHKRWQVFHAGSEMAYVPGPERARSGLQLRTPPHHCPLLVAKGYGMAIRAALEAAGAKDVEVVTTTREPSTIDFDLRWT